MRSDVTTGRDWPRPGHDGFPKGRTLLPPSFTRWEYLGAPGPLALNNVLGRRKDS